MLIPELLPGDSPDAAYIGNAIALIIGVVIACTHIIYKKLYNINIKK